MSLIALNTFLLNDLKRQWPYIWYMDKAKTYSLQNLSTTIRACHFFFFCQEIFFIFFFGFSKFWFLNFGPTRSEFPIVFEIFVNMFWRAEGFGVCVCCLILGLATSCVLYLFIYLSLARKGNT